MPNDRTAVLLALATVLCWSSVATAFKLALAALTPLQLLAIANCTAVIGLGAYLLARDGRLAPPAPASRSAWLGMLNPLVYYVVLFAAYDALPAQEALAINYTWALMLTWLAVPFLGHRLTVVDVVAGFIAYAGVVVIVSRGELSGFAFENLFGTTLALLSTVVWAAYWIASARDDREGVSALFWNFAFALGPVVLLASVLDGWPAGAGVDSLLAAVWVGCFEMALPFVLWLFALKAASRTAVISSLVFLSPVLSLFLIQAVLGEAILPTTWAGLSMILVAIAAQRMLAPKVVEP